jgi:hypothetical protein
MSHTVNCLSNLDNSESVQNQVQAQTYRYDCIRGIFQGLLNAGWMTFALLIAIDVYHAESFLKAVISSGLGSLFNPWTLSLASRTNFTANTICAGFLFVSSALIIFSGWTHHLWLYTFLIVGWRLSLTQLAPFMLQIYAHNYKVSERGKRIATGLTIAAITGTLFSYFAGKALDLDLYYGRWILFSIGLASIGCAIAILKMPARSLALGHTDSVWIHISWLWKDSLFGLITIAWTLSSLAHWMLFPIRFEYMLQPQYGICATNDQVALMTFGIPAIAQTLSTPLWGKLFDKLNFALVKVLVNAFYFMGFISFFCLKHLFFLGVGSALIGIATAGATLVWGIWVTKVASIERVPAYMSVHTAISGLRGLISPFLGYYLLAQASLVHSYIIGLIMIAISMILFFALRKHQRFV